MTPLLPRASENPFLENDLAKYVPTTKVEEWKYTNIQSVKAHLTVPEKSWQTDDLEKLLPVVSGPAIVMVGGVVVKELCTLEALPAHITLGTTLPAFPANPVQRAAQGTLAEIAFALDKTPLTIHVAASASEATLHLITVGWGHGGPAGGGVQVHLAAGAKLLLVEHLVGGHTQHDAAPLWLNTARQFSVSPGAHLRHVLLQNLPRTTVFTQTQQVAVADAAHYSAFTLQTGGHIARQESDLTLGANTHLAHHSLQLTGPGVTHDVTTRMALTGYAPACNVTQRNLVGGNHEEGGHAVFQGKFHVTQAAQKTDAYMRCENLLLHDAARVSQKPELEIYADDVKCSHGASTGSLDAEQLFYLKARGIDEATARQLLVSGFIEAQAEKFPAEVQPLIRPLITHAVKEVVL